MRVTTTSGIVEGEAGRHGLVFRGIAFASAGRLAPPRAPTRWRGVRPARSFGPQAPQLPSILDRMLGPAGLAQSEDCLSLNVWTPATDGVRRPMLVWVHGGAFTNGTGAAPWFDGSSFARDGCVLVSVNYRLGALGYLHLADLTHQVDPGGFGDASGNLGLLDQLAALRWVRENGESFGGDPDDVTLLGESAGGASVLALLASPQSAGLVHKGWALSPSITQLRTRSRATEAAEEVLTALGVGRCDARRLLELPLPQLLAAQAEVLQTSHDPFGAFAPTPGDAVLPVPVVEALAAGAAREVPLVLGTTRDEMSLFTAFDPKALAMDGPALDRYASRLFGDDGREAVAAYRAARPGSSPGQLASAMSTDEAFRAPATRLAEARHAAGAPTWLSSFTWASTSFGGVLGSCHGLDIPFAFDGLDGPGVELFTGDAPERAALARTFHRAIVDFATTGEASWPRYDPAERAVWRIDVPDEVVHDPEPELRRLWR